MSENIVDLNLLENHIDAPIKKAVVGLSLLGFKTAMSCCGFDYKGEHVKKTHLQNKPYIYIYSPLPDAEDRMSEWQKHLLFNIAVDSGWSIAPLYNSVFIDFHCHAWSKDHPWAAEGCLHRHEDNNIKISLLERSLEKREYLFKPSVTIKDGNSLYKTWFKHWQYEPVKDWTVTPDVFFSL